MNRYWFGLLLVACLLVALCAGVYRGSAENVTIVVQEKERVADSDSSKYLIWAEDGDVFENTDSLWFGKFNSSDLYGDLMVGNEYCVTVAGWRIPFFSMYRNIIRFCK